MYSAHSHRRESLVDQIQMDVTRDEREHWAKRLPKPVNELQKYEITMVGGHLCRVLEVNNLGSNLSQVVGRDLYLWELVDVVVPSEEIALDPHLVRNEYILGNITDDGYVCIDPKTSKVITVPKRPGFLCDKVQDLFDSSIGEVRVTVGKTPDGQGVVDYRLFTGDGGRRFSHDIGE